MSFLERESLNRHRFKPEKKLKHVSHLESKAYMFLIDIIYNIQS